MFQRLRNLLTRSMNPQQLRQFVYGPPTIAGVAVSEEVALGISAVWRAVDLKSSTVAGLECEVFRDVEGRGHVGLPRHWVSQLLRDPNDEQNGLKFWTAFLLQVVCAGRAYAEIERDDDDRPVGLHLLHWRNVRVMRLDDGRLVYRLLKEGKDLPAEDVLHVFEVSWDGLEGISPIQANRETLGTHVAADRHAGSTFGNNGVPRGLIKVDQVPNPDTKLAIRELWDTVHGGPANSNKVGLLFAGMEWVATNMTPADQQLLESRAFQIAEVSRIFGVPPNLLFSGQQSYNSNEEANLAFYELGLARLVERLQAELTFKLLTRGERLAGYAIRYLVEKKFPRITAAKSNSWRGLVLSGLATQNEARNALGLNPIGGADVLLVPTNLAIGTDADGNEVLKAGLAPRALPAPGPNPVEAD